MVAEKTKFPDQPTENGEIILDYPGEPNIITKDLTNG